MKTLSKRLSALVLSAALLAGTARAAGAGMSNFTQSTPYTPFTDVSADAWYASDVERAVRLGLFNGKVSELDRWHWVTIIGMDGPMVHILDSGREFPIDLSLWYETTKKRGGFVAVLPAEGQAAQTI